MTTDTHYQTGRGTLCSLDNDASIRTHTEDVSTVTCKYCLNQLASSSASVASHTPEPRNETRGGYHGYKIRKADWRGYKVTTPLGETWIDIAPTFKIATKWIECDQSEKRHLRLNKANPNTATN